jgi:XTP/dITP diphosphohydrolase
MTKLLFATNNRHKIEEIQNAVTNRIIITGLKDAGINIDIPEPYDSIERNAFEKSSTIFALTGMNCFSEDTGLEVESLNGEPGVRSARYAGDNATGEQNIDKLLRNLDGVENRKAQFRTMISLIWNGERHFFEGKCEGVILTERRGTGGFGYDSVFMPTDSNRSFGEMGMQEKNRYSHRRKAADKLVLFLQQHSHITAE